MSPLIIKHKEGLIPYTTTAREVYAKAGKQVRYLNVVTDPKQLEVMLGHSKGQRKVPVIVEGDLVTIGLKGKT
jgi:glutaredoxin